MPDWVTVFIFRNNFIPSPGPTSSVRPVITIHLLSPEQQPENIPPEIRPVAAGTSAENVLPTVEQTEIPPLSGVEALVKEQPLTEENMEVHHHSHAHGKKNWKFYFWEFLMLFLAVFCGFLAEYQLEHVVEHQREKQYIESLLADLKSHQEVLS